MVASYMFVVGIQWYRRYRIALGITLSQFKVLSIGTYPRKPLTKVQKPGVFATVIFWEDHFICRQCQQGFYKVTI